MGTRSGALWSMAARRRSRGVMPALPDDTGSLLPLAARRSGRAKGRDEPLEALDGDRGVLGVSVGTDLVCIREVEGGAADRDPDAGAGAGLADLLDEGREFVVKAELPGVSKEDLDIRVTEDGIELEAQTHVETEAREKEYYYRERADRAFHRALSFPDTVVPGEARATLKDGVLEVRVPRKEPAHRQEPVKVRVE